MKLTWLSDIHLEFLAMDRARRFLEKVNLGCPDAVLITGDISTAPEMRHHLWLVAEILKCPIYFVLGNHDFYSGGFAKVNFVVRAVCQDFPHLKPLGNGEVIALTARTALIGHSGWADGRAGIGLRGKKFLVQASPTFSINTGAKNIPLEDLTARVFQSLGISKWEERFSYNCCRALEHFLAEGSTGDGAVAFEPMADQVC